MHCYVEKTLKKSLMYCQLPGFFLFNGCFGWLSFAAFVRFSMKLDFIGDFDLV